jgi:hypothetical protein
MVSYLDQGGVQHLVDKLLDRMYPVDSIYISTNSTSPASLYGGSWERYGTGRALISASDTDSDFTAGTTGGSKTHSHNPGTLSAQVSLAGKDTVVRRVKISLFKGDVRRIGDVYGGSFEATWGAAIVGHSDDASSMGPYVAVYVWRRTA